MKALLDVCHICGKEGGARSRPDVSPERRRPCPPCHRRVRTELTELPALYADCASALVPRRNPVLPRVSGSRHATGIVLDERALATRSSILGLLASWAGLVADEGHVARPARLDPTGLAAFLLTHLDWLLDHPAAADFADELAQVTQSARSARSQPPGMELGECVHPDCTAPLTATPPSGDSRSAHEVRCTAGHTWQPHQWLQLFRQLQQTGRCRAAPGRRRPGEPA